MTKLLKKKPTFVPQEGQAPILGALQNDTEFKANINSWLAEWQTMHRNFHGAAFVGWCNEMIANTEDVLSRLYYRFAIPPSKVLAELARQKQHLLTQIQLESGDWIVDVPSWYIGQAQLWRDDSHMATMLRNKKLNDQNAQYLEEAARVLIEYPPYLGVVRDMRDPWGLPDRLKLIAADIRKRRVERKHRPQAHVARSVITSLTSIFRTITGKPLYKYAGLLTQICFPGEWEVRDGREAAKKLVKSHERRQAAQLIQRSRDIDSRGLPKLVRLAGLIRQSKIKTVNDLAKRVPDLARMVSSCRKIDHQFKHSVPPPRTVKQLQAMITNLRFRRKSVKEVWKRLDSFLRSQIADSPLYGDAP
jgi:hypothetical protein